MGNPSMTGRQAVRRIEFIIGYEPSWFAEFTSAFGIFVWGVATLLTNDFDISGWEWSLPVAALIFGPARVLLLFHLDPLPRVLAACVGFVWWAWLNWSLFKSFGILPSHGAFSVPVVGDMLTVSKFSLAVLRLRREDYGDGV